MMSRYLSNIYWIYVLFSNNLLSIPIINNFFYGGENFILVYSLEKIFPGSLRRFVDIALLSIYLYCLDIVPHFA